MKKICISKNWNFSMPELPGKKTVDLPHDYSVTLPRDPKSAGGASVGFFGGTKGSYVKYMKFEPAEHTILDIDGAYMCARIYLNNDLLDMHPYGYTPYLVDLSEKIKKGKTNRIAIDVLNVQPSSRWYSGAGLYRDVFIWSGGKTRIEPWDMFIITKSIHKTYAEILLKFRISSDVPYNTDISFDIEDSDGKSILQKTINLTVTTGKNNCEVILKIENPILWDCENPYLYTLKTEISANGKIEDTSENIFGIRTVTADTENGLMLNGKTIKLKGGCIHHDHGVLGSAEFPAAVHRKLSLLKSVGYNAVRSSHYPPSLALLEICDKIGMLVMDEAFDMWNMPKNDLDYSLWFKDWWQRDISYMVCRDRNHPCVISYSIGNEILERSGISDGAEWSKKLSDEIRKYDNTKLVTSGICGMFDYCEPYAPKDYIDDYYTPYSDCGNGELDSSWNSRTEAYMKPLDIVGYNYLYFRYEYDSEKYKNRIFWGSETHALTFFDSWSSVMRNKNVIGDFTWTAYDNLGEAGAGVSSWGEDDYVPYIRLEKYPWRTCFQGDFDICGYRRPQSYFREAIWNEDAEPHIFTTHPKHNGDTLSGTGWHWYDVSETWTFEDEYIGYPIKTDVYTTADEVVFILNGCETARAVPVKGIASADIPYEKGEIKAVLIRNGCEDKTAILKTTDVPYKIHTLPEKNEIIADNRDLCYFNIFIEDKYGNLVRESDCEIECTVYGGELLGVFSGCPNNDDAYGSDKCHVFNGSALAIVRCTVPFDTIKLYVSSKGLKGGICDNVRTILPQNK